ncbi:hypothetical protein FS837_008950 [Tulasnella sp. UAMH 9824]|nr:hypothetical protein FS837_008950 [Tulasnella sp. UAMH 9824]
MDGEDSIQIDVKAFQNIANRYRSARSPEEKDVPRQAFDEWLDKLQDESLIKFPGVAKLPWDLLRMSGLPEQALQAVVELRGSSNTQVFLNSLMPFTLIVKIDLNADGFAFGEAVIVNLPGLATQVSEIAQQPQIPTLVYFPLFSAFYYL